jgi:hypothetical protein
MSNSAAMGQEILYLGSERNFSQTITPKLIILTTVFKSSKMERK